MDERTAAAALLAAALLAFPPATAAAGEAAQPPGRKGQMTSAPPAADSPAADSLAADLAVVRQARIYFYHHSVGLNLLDGLQRLAADARGAGLKLASAAEAAAADGPVLAHGEGGENRRPGTKIDFFAATLRAHPALAPELAFMKFCYVDFGPATDVDALFAHYKGTLDALKREFPRVRFGHATVPVTASPSDLKSRARRLVGLEVWDDAANARRAEFSRRVRDGFPGDPVLELAAVESTDPETGAQATSPNAGQRYPALLPRFTEDGGHLNAEGGRVAGAALLRFMAAALRSRPEAAAR